MEQTRRIQHIDSLRGLAVLLMVMVHAAATWNPFDSIQPTLLAYLISGLGGLAAPLFITLFGWGVLRNESSVPQRIFQSMFLFIMQILVNLTSPHLFQPFTPGVLSLMALLNVILPPLSKYFTGQKLHPLFGLSVVFFAIQLNFPEVQGTGTWSDRVAAESPSTILSNLFLTGTYPLFPWMLFAVLGATISMNGLNEGADLPNTARNRYLVGFGLLFCIVSFYTSRANGALWAHPTADAYLTFFPANAPFLITGGVGVVLIWFLLQNATLTLFQSAGRLSLTIYIIHFIPLTFMRNFDAHYSWSLGVSALAVLSYTLVWIPISALWIAYYPRANIESLARLIRKSLF